MLRIKPALLRQATYGTLKLGFYQYLKKMANSLSKICFVWSNKRKNDLNYLIKLESSQDQSFILNIFCGMFSGATANAIANPTDVLKVRMQSNQKSFLNKSLFSLFLEIYQQEGFKGLYRVFCWF